MKGEDNKYKILIVDDDEFLLDMYSLKFRQAGIAVEIASDGIQALEKVKQGEMGDAILLDLTMPNMDGFEFLEIIKKNDLAKDVKIIILSNLGQKENIEKGMSLGADDYIVKAYFTPLQVVNKVKSLLGAGKKK